MKNQDLDRLISQIRDESVSDEVIRGASSRVREAISASQFADDAGHKLRGCRDFQSLIPSYLSARLTPARTLLMEDHLHQCVACRHELAAARTQSRPFRAPRRMETTHLPALRWVLSGALAAGIAIGVFAGNAGLLPGQHVPRATVASVDGSAFYVADSGSRLVPAGYKLTDGDEFRTGKDSRAEVQLSDGSEIEMDERSQLSVSRGWRGTTIHLDGGHIIVEAAHRRTGGLYVATEDCLVASKGTVFVVNHGTKGSRVSVLEGAVNVAYGQRHEELQAGGQVTSSGDISRVPIQEDVAWSKNSAKYLALLGEFRVLQKQWERIPGPGLRYQSDLLQYVPPSTVVYAAIPNMGSTLGEASRVFEDRLQQSPVLRSWWKQQQGLKGPQLEDAMSRIETFSNYLGDEVVLAMARGENYEQENPVLLAEVRRPGLREFLESQDRELFSGNGHPAFQLVDDPAHVRQAANPVPLIYIGDNLMVVAMDPYQLELIRRLARDREASRFRETPFYQNITHSYRDGAGWLFSVDMEQILGDYVHNPRTKEPLPPGFDNLKYLTVEQRDIGKTETHASITFAPVRTGIPAWLGEPAPMGSLDFVSPEASLAAAFVIKDPKSVVDEIFQFAESTDPNFQDHLGQLESTLGVSIRDDISGPLGGEVTLAFDGPVLPTPSWKVIVEVYDRGSLQATLSKLVDSFNRQAPPEDGKFELSERQIGSVNYFTLRNDKRSFEMDYAFVDSYWIIGPSQSLIARAIQNRQAGYVLTRSQAFKEQLPTDGYTNFSALFYHNIGPTLTPLAQQLKSTGALTADEQGDLDALRAYSAPGLIYAYGEPDRIIVASNSGFMGLNLDTLLAIAQGKPVVLSHLFGNGRGARHGTKQLRQW